MARSVTPRPSHQSALLARLNAWMTEVGGLPRRTAQADGTQLAQDLRRAYARGTLAPETLSSLELLADSTGVSLDRWLTPRPPAGANLAALAAFVVEMGRLPHAHERYLGRSIGRWLSRQRAAERAGRLAPERRATLEVLAALKESEE